MSEGKSYRGGKVEPPKLPPVLLRILERSDRSSMTAHFLQLANEQNPGAGPIAWAYALELKDRDDPSSITSTVRTMYREVLENRGKRRPVEQK